MLSPWHYHRDHWFYQLTRARFLKLARVRHVRLACFRPFRYHNISKRAVAQTHGLTAIQKKRILDKHNELRRIVKPEASNMLKMKWYEYLEKLAQDYSRRCVFEHNPVSSFYTCVTVAVVIWLWSWSWMYSIKSKDQTIRNCVLWINLAQNTTGNARTISPAGDTNLLSGVAAPDNIQWAFEIWETKRLDAGVSGVWSR